MCSHFNSGHLSILIFLCRLNIIFFFKTCISEHLNKKVYKPFGQKQMISVLVIRTGRNDESPIYGILNFVSLALLAVLYSTV